jgi:hypothetical protein
MTKKKGTGKNDKNMEQSVDGVEKDASSSTTAVPTIQGLTPPAVDKEKRFLMCIQSKLMK